MNCFGKTDQRILLEDAKNQIIKSSVLWDLYALNFGAAYAQKVTFYTRKMLDDDLDAIKMLEAELNELGNIPD